MTIRIRRHFLQPIIMAMLYLGVSSIGFASTAIDTYNADKGPGYALPRPPCCSWNVDNIGWYWTANQSTSLTSIQTKLADVDFGYDNGFFMTVGIYTDRPAVGGTLLGSFRYDAAHFLAGSEPWRGGFFASPVPITEGTQYFIGMSGWTNDRYSNNGAGGINWVIDGFTGLPPADAQFLGIAYINAGWADAIGTPTTVTAAPVLQFVATPIPIPSAAILFASTLFGLGFLRRPTRKS